MTGNATIDPVSHALGLIQGELEAIRREQDEARCDHKVMSAKLDSVASDVTEMKTKIANIEPTVKLVNEMRLKALGLIAGLSMLSGVFGSYVKDKFFS